MRDAVFSEPHYRIIHGDADGLPGLVVDRFGDTVVIQTSTAGMDLLIDYVVSALKSVIAPKHILLNNEGGFRNLEGLDTLSKTLQGEI